MLILLLVIFCLFLYMYGDKDDINSFFNIGTVIYMLIGAVIYTITDSALITFVALLFTAFIFAVI